MLSKVIVGLCASSGLAALSPDVPTVPINGVAGTVRMPLVGMGTWTDSESVAESSVELAFAAGYRHVDTALVYANQDAVGRALKASKVPRNEYFVTSKIPPGNATATVQNLQTALDQLDLKYVDLMLIHYNDPNISSPQQRKEQWKVMETWAKAGKARAIGVSHFCKTHIEDILEVATVPIAVDQVQYHVGMGESMPNANDDKAFIQSKGILYESFSPLCGPCNPPDNTELITGKLVTDIGNAHNKSGVQVALKWLVQQGIPVIPRSSNPVHIKENMDLFDFELSAAEMQQLTSATSPAVAAGPSPQDSGDCSLPAEFMV
jgi:diketogulonate reductase-like aldo/keto reductase